MKKKIIVGAIYLAGVALVCVALFFAADVSREGKIKPPMPQPDTVVTSTLPNEMVYADNKTAGYAIAIPKNWYLERSAGSGVTVYPKADCKIEISKLANPDQKNLADWLTKYLHADPTADVSEISRATTTVGGAPAIIWIGALNGVSSTLAYVAADGSVIEIAPSIIAASGSAPSNIDCGSAFQTILHNFQFAK